MTRVSVVTVVHSDHSHLVLRTTTLVPQRILLSHAATIRKMD